MSSQESEVRTNQNQIDHIVFEPELTGFVPDQIQILPYLKI